jgi:formamidopyrimidine-DNA glycosylase
MPELPEVETVRRGVDGLFVGDTLVDIAVSGARTVRRHPPERLAELRGRPLAGTGRHGKYLLTRWDGGPELVVHLRMSGQLLAAAPGTGLVPHTHAVLRFAAAGELRFVDPRTFGELFLAQPGRPELGHLGPDALAVTPAQLSAALAGRRAPLKCLLVDQRVLAGIGNIYADEICFRAGLRPDRAAGSLRPEEVATVVGATRAVLTESIAARGSSLADQQYRDLFGALGSYQLNHRVYGRVGLPCPSCGQPIERVPIGARRAFMCASCQA